MTNEDLGRDAHWFDGDGMLSGVSFRRMGDSGTTLQPEFVNQYILTDVFISSKTSRNLRTPILPSIATLVNPAGTLITIILRILRTLLLVILSHLPGSVQAIKKISVANTAFLYHDGRALATCESGPPMRIALPGLETIGWFDGAKAEGEGHAVRGTVLGGEGLLSWMKEWTTGHPRVDPKTSELVLFHSTFVPPYIHYSVLPSTRKTARKLSREVAPRLVSVPVSGIKAPKMMHDFGVSLNNTVIMDLPLSLDPLNLAKNKPVVSYDPTSRSRFGIFPRYQPNEVTWFDTNPCCIFHTANTWDSMTTNLSSGVLEATSVNMLVCRLTSASLVFSAGDIAAPIPVAKIPASIMEEEQCRLYYYSFSLTSSPPSITDQYSLSAIPFEFPSLRSDVAMSAARYVYGCTMEISSFGAALGRAVKIDAIAKIDIEALIARGKANPPEQIRGCVDNRTVTEVLASKDDHDPIKIFKLPDGWYCQEPRFVPRANGQCEDDGWLLSYVFDESTQLCEDGECQSDARSELWIIDARDMSTLVARVTLPQRVPYGLHGNWFEEAEIANQRPFESVRSLPAAKKPDDGSQSGTITWNTWIYINMRDNLERWLR